MSEYGVNIILKQQERLWGWLTCLCEFVSLAGSKLTWAMACQALKGMHKITTVFVS